MTKAQVQVLGRMKGSLLAIALLASGLMGCSDSPTAVSTDGIPARVEMIFTELAVNSLGDTITMGARVLDARGREVPQATVTWRYEGDPILSPDPNVPGRYVSVATGSGRIIAEVSRGGRGGSVFGQLPVVVMQVPAGLFIEASQSTLWSIGFEGVLTARAVDARGNPIPMLPHELVWSSAEPQVARVDQRGRVRAVRDGEALIRLDYGGLSTTLPVRVASTFGLSVCYSFDGISQVRGAGQSPACGALTVETREPGAGEGSP
jgi:hypothetical protein